MTEFRRADYCVIACAEAFRGDGEIMASPMGTTPSIGARLARATFEPDLVLTDGVSSVLSGNFPVGSRPDSAVQEGWMPYRRVFETLWWGRRHVMMGASQLDQYGNQNISCIGDFQRPKVQLLGVRGAPGNTICHPTSYWISSHNRRVFVENVDMVSGVGYDRAAALPEQSRQSHEIRRVISDLGVFDFDSSSGRMRVLSLHPGVEASEVQEQTGFELVLPGSVPTTRPPTEEEHRLLEEVIDPKGLRFREVAA